MAWRHLGLEDRPAGNAGPGLAVAADVEAVLVVGPGLGGGLGGDGPVAGGLLEAGERPLLEPRHEGLVGPDVAW